jgi:hypothetical protein
VIDCKRCGLKHRYYAAGSGPRRRAARRPGRRVRPAMDSGQGEAGPGQADQELRRAAPRRDRDRGRPRAGPTRAPIREELQLPGLAGPTRWRGAR